ncbi:hypothetical protein HYH03_005885 [Edaphochlamys debaryana]|uniref:Uncharacterized protein n=1 Tax=Edaphochlamys debaryana TaxID=47281 RepID=A0A836C0P6_9CHLO|nr:hypothetical protein HYH03_005885 [Edaphochlamys debaryana]|eukprot:KAG2495955.1 hypothetical protein HYH03_005885 [Edaphochlamys debaryana]
MPPVAFQGHNGFKLSAATELEVPPRIGNGGQQLGRTHQGTLLASPWVKFTELFTLDHYNEKDKKGRNIVRTAIKAHNGKHLSAEPYGDFSFATECGVNEKFELIQVEDEDEDGGGFKVAIKTCYNSYLSVGRNLKIKQAPTVTGWALFILLEDPPRED